MKRLILAIVLIASACVAEDKKLKPLSDAEQVKVLQARYQALAAQVASLQNQLAFYQSPQVQQAMTRVSVTAAGAQQAEKEILDQRGLKREDFYVDQDGKLQPVPKPEPPKAPEPKTEKRP